jgi:hypothetical protein
VSPTPFLSCPATACDASPFRRPFISAQVLQATACDASPFRRPYLPAPSGGLHWGMVHGTATVSTWSGRSPTPYYHNIRALCQLVGAAV